MKTTLSYAWSPFDGNYEKHMQDIKLKTGEVILQCWPNAGVFHSMDGKHEISVEMISFVRLNFETYGNTIFFETNAECYRNRIFDIDEVSKLINSLLKQEISIGRFVEILNEKSTGLHPLEIANIRALLLNNPSNKF